MFAFRHRLYFGCISLALLVLGLGTGCGNTEKPSALLETDESQYRYGLQMEHDGRQDDALAAFARVIKSREDDAPESQLESGQIYLNIKNDPVSAIYHFQRFLIAKPKAEQAPMVAQLIETAKKNFARALPGHPGIYDEADMQDQIRNLQIENDNLRKQLGNSAALHVTPMASDRPTPAAVAPSAPVVPTPVASTRPLAAAPLRGPVSAPVTVAPTRVTAASASRTYTVESGDTLSSISLKALGSRSRWTEIYNANRDKLPSTDSPLHIGMILNLPPQ